MAILFTPALSTVHNVSYRHMYAYLRVRYTLARHARTRPDKQSAEPWKREKKKIEVIKNAHPSSSEVQDAHADSGNKSSLESQGPLRRYEYIGMYHIHRSVHHKNSRHYSLLSICSHLSATGNPVTRKHEMRWKGAGVAMVLHHQEGYYGNAANAAK